jgi:hypothetical protein
VAAVAVALHDDEWRGLKNKPHLAVMLEYQPRP